MTHIFKVSATGNSGYLKLSHVDETTITEHTLGVYPYMSYILRAAEKYFIYQYKASDKDTYIIFWPKYDSISIACRDVPEEAI